MKTPFPHTRTQGSSLLKSETSTESQLDTISPSDLENMTYYARGNFAEIYRAQWCGVVVAVKRLPFGQKIDADKVCPPSLSPLSLFICS